MASKFNLTQLMNDKSKNESGNDTIAFKIDLIPIEKIEPSKMNIYSVDDIQELKQSIELIGLQQNLLVRQIESTGNYEIISGHRRFKALQELNSEGEGDFNLVPCKIIKSTDDIQAELQLILANSTSRRLTDYEITHQAARLKELLSELKKSGFKFAGRTREVVAELLHVSPSQIGRMESINNNLSLELKDEFKKESISITTAYELSKLDEKRQEQAFHDHTTVSAINPERAKQYKEKPTEPQEAKEKEQVKEQPTLKVEQPIEKEPEEKEHSAYEVDCTIRFFQEALSSVNKMIEACEGINVPYAIAQKQKHYELAIKALELYKGEADA